MLGRASIVGWLVIAGCSGTTGPGPAGPSPDDEPATAVDAEPDPGADPAPPDPTAAGPTDPVAAGLLAAHNRARAEHCAPALTWSPALAAVATAWAESLAAHDCGFEHSSSSYGENLAAGTASALDADAVVAMWVDEVAAYDFRRPGFGMNTGHFTQVVWRGTTQLGCGTATCNGMSLWVCNYDPAGNVEGDFPANVAAAGCR